MTDEDYMREALHEAQAASLRGEVLSVRSLSMDKARLLRVRAMRPSRSVTRPPTLKSWRCVTRLMCPRITDWAG